jgi:hypothetical protein
VLDPVSGPHRLTCAVSLGADHTTWSRSQFVRLPDGTRDGGKRQVVHCFNPEALRTEPPN